MGGIEHQLIQLARHIDRRRCTQTFANLFLPRSGESGYARALAAEGFELLQGVPLSYRSVPRAIRVLWRWMFSMGTEVVHAHGFHAGVLALSLARLRPGLRFVVTRHGDTAYRDEFMRPWDRAFDRLMVRYSHHVVALTSKEAAVLREKDSISPARLSVIPNGIDLGHFDARLGRVKAEARGAALRLLYLARVHPVKGHTHLLDALALVRSGPDPVDAQLILAGGGDLDTLRAEIARRDLGDAVRALGHVPEDRVPSLIEDVDVYVHPSLQDCFSVALLQAMAASRPIVATAVGGTPELLGGVARLVAPGDPVALAAAIRETLADPDASARGELGRRRVEARFRAEKIAELHEELYESQASLLRKRKEPS